MKSLLFDDNLTLNEVNLMKNDILNSEPTVLFQQTFESRTPTFDEKCETRLLQEAKNIDENNKIYGIPSLKKYPMPDEKHVRSAVRFFNYVDAEHEEELAKNINKNIKKFGIKDLHVGPKNRFAKYYNGKVKAVKESEMKYHETIDKVYGLMPNGVYEQFDSVSDYKNKYNMALNEASLINDSELIFEGKIEKLERNGKIIKKPDTCPKCGSKKIIICIAGEPICKCKDCGEYIGTVPCKEAYMIEDAIEFVEKSEKYKLNNINENTVNDLFKNLDQIPDDQEKSELTTAICKNITDICQKAKSCCDDTSCTFTYDGYIKKIFPEYMKGLGSEELEKISKCSKLNGFTDNDNLKSIDTAIKSTVENAKLNSVNIENLKNLNSFREDLNYIKGLAESLIDSSILGNRYKEETYKMMQEMVGIDKYDVFDSTSIQYKLDEYAKIDIEKARSKEISNFISSVVGKLCAKLKYILGQADIYNKDVKYDGYIMALFPKYIDMMRAKDLYNLIESIREHAFTTGVGHKSLNDVIKMNQNSSRDSSAFIYNETLKVRRDLSSFLYLCEDKYKKERFDGINPQADSSIGEATLDVNVNHNHNININGLNLPKGKERKPIDKDKAKKVAVGSLVGAAATAGLVYGAKKLDGYLEKRENIKKEHLQEEAEILEEAMKSRIINTDDNGYFITDIKFRDRIRISIAARYLEDAQKNIPFIIKTLTNIERSYDNIINVIKTELYQKYCKNHGSLDADKFNREFDKMQIQNNIIVYRDKYGCIFEFNYPINQYIDGNVLTIVFKSNNEGIIEKFGYTTEIDSRI